jgi:hypothetical protein
MHPSRQNAPPPDATSSSGTARPADAPAAPSVPLQPWPISVSGSASGTAFQFAPLPVPGAAAAVAAADGMEFDPMLNTQRRAMAVVAPAPVFRSLAPAAEFDADDNAYRSLAVEEPFDDRAQYDYGQGSTAMSLHDKQAYDLVFHTHMHSAYSISDTPAAVAPLPPALPEWANQHRLLVVVCASVSALRASLEGITFIGFHFFNVPGFFYSFFPAKKASDSSSHSD